MKVIESAVIFDNQNHVARFRLVGNINEVYAQVNNL